MKQIKTFESFNTPTNIPHTVYRGLNRDFNTDYDDIQYYAENKEYAKVFGDNVKAFNIDLQDVLDLDKWNAKLSAESKEYYNDNLFTIHSTYLNKESEDYGYRGLRDTLLRELGKEEFINFQKEFNSARIIKGRDSGNESQIVYAVRDKSLIKEL